MTCALRVNIYASVSVDARSFSGGLANSNWVGRAIKYAGYPMLSRGKEGMESSLCSHYTRLLVCGKHD